MKFRKKPIVIDAVKWDGLAGTANLFIGEHYGYSWWYWDDPSGQEKNSIVIPTLEGNMIGKVGDWLIRGVKGEFYPCKADIFEATYEPVKT